jgi:hypothetical protein
MHEALIFIRRAWNNVKVEPKQQNRSVIPTAFVPIDRRVLPCDHNVVFESCQRAGLWRITGWGIRCLLTHRCFTRMRRNVEGYTDLAQALIRNATGSLVPEKELNSKRERARYLTQHLDQLHQVVLRYELTDAIYAMEGTFEEYFTEERIRNGTDPLNGLVRAILNNVHVHQTWYRACAKIYSLLKEEAAAKQVPLAPGVDAAFRASENTIKVVVENTSTTVAGKAPVAGVGHPLPPRMHTIILYDDDDDDDDESEEQDEEDTAEVEAILQADADEDTSVMAPGSWIANLPDAPPTEAPPEPEPGRIMTRSRTALLMPPATPAPPVPAVARMGPALPPPPATPPPAVARMGPALPAPPATPPPALARMGPTLPAPPATPPPALARMGPALPAPPATPPPALARMGPAMAALQVPPATPQAAGALTALPVQPATPAPLASPAPPRTAFLVRATPRASRRCPLHPSCHLLQSSNSRSTSVGYLWHIAL